MIELRGVRKVYPGGVTALDGVDLTVAEGEIHGIVGRSGAGKSTLIRCLTGLDRVTSGEVSIDGTRISSARGPALRSARRRIGMVFQHVNLLDSRTAEQNIAHPLEVAGVPGRDRRRRVTELLDLVGLAPQRSSYPSQLSGGQKQRVGIARALAAEPAVLLCDEPTSALDTATTRQILGLIRSLRDRLGITVVIITHEMSVVREVCDSVSLLADGRIERSGRLLDVIRDTSSPLSKELIPLPPVHLADEGALVEVLLGTEGGADLAGLFHILEGAGLAAEITAGTVETIRGRQVGRIHLAPPSRGDAERILAALRQEGVHAELTSARTVLGEASEA